MPRAMSAVRRALRPLWAVCIVPDIFMPVTCCRGKCFQYVFSSIFVTMIRHHVPGYLEEKDLLEHLVPEL